MARLKNALKAGESYTGKVAEVSDKVVIFETKDGVQEKIPFPENVLEEIDDDHNGLLGGDIITVSLNEKGEYDITEHEDWPEENPKK